MDKNTEPDLVVAPALPLVLPVIHPTIATYVVACSTPPVDPWEDLPQRLVAETPGDLLDDVRRVAFGSADIDVRTGLTVPPGYWDLALCVGTDPALVRRAQRAKHHLLVRCPGRPGQPIEHWWAALAIARALRRRTRGVLLDVVVNRIVEHRPAGGQGGQRGQAGQWGQGGLPGQAGQWGQGGPVDPLAPRARQALSRWTWVHYSPESDGTFWLTLDGLERFGLPALSLGGVPDHHLHECYLLLMGLGARLVQHQAEAVGHLLDPPALREVPRRWTITAADVAGAFPLDERPDLSVGPLTFELHETANDVLGGRPMLDVTWVGS